MFVAPFFGLAHKPGIIWINRPANLGRPLHQPLPPRYAHFAPVGLNFPNRHYDICFPNPPQSGHFHLPLYALMIIAATFGTLDTGPN